MGLAYEKLVDFSAAGPSSKAVADYQTSQQTKVVVAELLHREKTAELRDEERAELDHFPSS
jgi:hypothetical protein